MMFSSLHTKIKCYLVFVTICMKYNFFGRISYKFCFMQNKINLIKINIYFFNLCAKTLKFYYFEREGIL